MRYQHLEIERKGHVAWLWLDRPEKLNAMSADIWDDIPRAMTELDGDRNVRVIVIAGKGSSFSVGIDINMLAALGGSSSSPEETYATIRHLQTTFSCLAASPKPVIAAIHGYCLGAGTNLIAACDLRLAAADAVFSIRETRMGLVADVGALQRLPHVIGLANTAEMALTGDDYDAAWALERGLVSTVLPGHGKLFDRTQELAESIAANSPLVTSGVKQVLRAGTGRTVDEGLEIVAKWNSEHLISNDLFEAMAAHLEKRPPNYTGT